MSADRSSVPRRGDLSLDLPRISWLSATGEVRRDSRSGVGAAAFTVGRPRADLGTMFACCADLMSNGEILVCRLFYTPSEAPWDQSHVVFVAVDAADGTSLWETEPEIGWPYVVGEGSDVAWVRNHETHGMRALSLRDGSTVATIGGVGYGSCGVVPPTALWAGSVILTDDNADTITLYSLQNGAMAIRWRQPIGDVFIDGDYPIMFTRCGSYFIIVNNAQESFYHLMDGTPCMDVLDWDGQRRRELLAAYTPHDILTVSDFTPPTLTRRTAHGTIGLPLAGEDVPHYDLQLLNRPAGGPSYEAVVVAERVILLVDGALNVLRRTHVDNLTAAWYWPPRQCAQHEYEVALAAVAAVDDMTDAVGNDAVGLVRAVLEGFVAEDARLVVLRQ